MSRGHKINWWNDGSILSYRAGYMLTHPWKIVAECWQRFRWAMQRGVRGWDDRVLWGIDYYLLEYLPVWLRELADKDVHGVPLSMLPDEHFENWKPDSEIHQEELDAGIERWRGILREIADGFKAGKRWSECDLAIYQEAHIIQDKEDRERGYRLPFCESMERFSQIVDQLEESERSRREMDELKAQFDQAMALFAEHFFVLND